MSKKKSIALLFAMCVVTVCATAGAVHLSQISVGHAYFAWLLFPFIFYVFAVILPIIGRR